MLSWPFPINMDEESMPFTLDCDEIKAGIQSLCLDAAAPSSSDVCSYSTASYPIDLCLLSDSQIKKRICKYGYNEEFLTSWRYPDDPVGCYCDEKCIGDFVWIVTGIVWAAIFFLGLSTVLMRWTRRRCFQPDDEKVEKMLSRKRKDKPTPQLTNCTYSMFKWMPVFFFVACYVLILAGAAALISLAFMYQSLWAWQTWTIIVAINFTIFSLLYMIQMMINSIIGCKRFERETNDVRPLEEHDIHHIIILPNYKEDPDMMKASIYRFANQESVDARKNITVVLGTEQREEGGLEKAMKIKEEFTGMFKEFIITRHPPLFGEQAGKASNCKWVYACLERFAIKDSSDQDQSEDNGDDAEGRFDYSDPSVNYTLELEQYFSHPDRISTTVVSEGFSFDPNKTIVSLVDADALIHERLLGRVNESFCNLPGMTGHLRLWHGFTLFYENLDELDFLNRCQTVLQTMMKMSDLGWIDFGIFSIEPKQPENTFHLSWRLLNLIDGGDNFVVPDEPHDLFKAMYLTEGHTRLEKIGVPVSVYNVSNDDQLKGMVAKYNQVVRWLFGNPYEFTYWAGVYLNPFRPNLGVPFFEWSGMLWKQFTMCTILPSTGFIGFLYGFFGTRMRMVSPYFEEIGNIFLSMLVFLFVLYPVVMNYCHWKAIYYFQITDVLRWPMLKKIGVSLFDSTIGYFVMILIIVPYVSLQSCIQMLKYKGVLAWGTEGRVEKRTENEQKIDGDIVKKKSRRSVAQAAKRIGTEAALYEENTLRKSGIELKPTVDMEC